MVLVWILVQTHYADISGTTEEMGTWTRYQGFTNFLNVKSVLFMQENDLESI